MVVQCGNSQNDMDYGISLNRTPANELLFQLQNKLSFEVAYAGPFI